MSIQTIVDRLVSGIKTGLPSTYLFVGGLSVNPPNVFPHIQIYSVRTTFSGARAIHQISLGVSTKNEGTTTDGTYITKYTGFYSLLALINDVKLAILNKMGFIRLEFLGEQIDSIESHGCYSARITFSCEEVIPQKSGNYQ